jgi:hypothetical protein
VPGYFAKPPHGARLNRADSLARGLTIAYLLADGGGVTARDSAGGPRTNGTLTNFAATAWAPGVYGRGLLFDGSNDFVSTPTGSVPETAAWTLVVACRFTSVTGAQALAIHANGGTGAGAWSATIGIRSSKLDGYFYDGSEQHTVGTTTLAAGTDYVIAFSADTRTDVYRVYLNGRNDTATSPGAAGAPSAAVNQMYLGATTSAYSGHDFTTRLGGTIHGVWRYNRALSAGEHRTIAADPFRMFRSRRAPVPLYPQSASAGNRRRRVLICSGGD